MYIIDAVGNEILIYEVSFNMNYAAIAEAIPPRNGSGTQEWIYQVLRYGIISGQLVPGMQLKQDEISDSLSVSHIPVREALRQLEAQHLVTIHPNRGASVSSITRESAIEMIQVLDAIRATMINTSIPHMTDDDINSLETCLNEQKACTDPFEFELLNNHFHKILVFLSSNGFANELSERIYANIGRYLRNDMFKTEEDRLQFITINEQLLEACKRKDLRGAASLLNTKMNLVISKIPNPLS